MERFIQHITKRAGLAVLKRFGKDGVHYTKSEHRGDAVTKADLLSDKIITSAIKKHYPKHGIISEESGTLRADAEYIWIIDPIDGTFNFATGVPLFGVMVALAQKGRIILSAIHLPTAGELYFAKRGKGAFLNGKRIRCSQIRDWSSTAGIGPTWLRPRATKFMQRLLKEAAGKRMLFSGLGSIAIDGAYIAAGKRDWFAGMNGQLHDFAAPSLLMKEAGCKVTNTRGEAWTIEDREIVAANPALHKQLLKLTKGV